MTDSQVDEHMPIILLIPAQVSNELVIIPQCSGHQFTPGRLKHFLHEVV